jgi:hypothetical protein
MANKIKINGNKNVNHEKIKAKVGITDKKNHTVFYLEGGTFMTPTIEFEDFTKIMDNVEIICKQKLKNKLSLNNYLDTNFLMHFEVCSDRMKRNKNTYLSFQYHFKQKNNLNDSILNVKEKNEFFFKSLLKDIENELTKYNIKLSKKRKNEVS